MRQVMSVITNDTSPVSVTFKFTYVVPSKGLGLFCDNRRDVSGNVSTSSMPVRSVITSTVSGQKSVSCHPRVRLLTTTRFKGIYWLLASRPVNVTLTVCAETTTNSSIMVRKVNVFFILVIIITMAKIKKNSGISLETQNFASRQW